MINRILNLYTFGKQEESLEASDTESLLPTEKDQTIATKNEPVDNEENSKLNSSKIIKFLFCFVGLQVSFLIWGLMQERIVKYGYDKMSHVEHSSEIKKKKLVNFKNSQFLVLSNRATGLVLSFMILIIFNRCKIRACFLSSVNFIFFTSSFEKIVSAKNWAPLYKCSYSSLTNVLSSWFQYESLKYVSFNTQLLAKSSKSLFVMLTGKVISNKSYKPYEYFCVLLIGFGVFLFSDIGNIDMSETKKCFPLRYQV